MEIKVLDTAYHRNGIAGNGFGVVLFLAKDEDNKEQTFLGIVFKEAGNVAVLKLSGHNGLDDRIIESGRNSWRGDMFETELHKAAFPSP